MNDGPNKVSKLLIMLDGLALYSKIINILLESKSTKSDGPSWTVIFISDQKSDGLVCLWA
jgi:hypothetical protein